MQGARQLAGGQYAWVEGLSNRDKRDRYVVTARHDTLRIECGREQHAENGAAAFPVVNFKAPDFISSVRCHGAAICVGAAAALFVSSQRVVEHAREDLEHRDRSRGEQLCGIALRVVMGCGSMADGVCCRFRIQRVLRKEWVAGVCTDRAIGLRVVSLLAT